MTIRHCERMNSEGIVHIAVEGWKSLLDSGLAEDVVLLGWDHKAFVAEEDGRPIGILCYQETDWRNELSITLGYVLPDCRERGIYRALWNALVEKAREKKCAAITGITSSENLRMQRVAEKLGRKQCSVTYRYSLKEVEE